MAATLSRTVSPHPALTALRGMSNHWSLVTKLQLEPSWHSRGHPTNSDLWLCSDKRDRTPHERWRRLNRAQQGSDVSGVSLKSVSDRKEQREDLLEE